MGAHSPAHGPPALALLAVAALLAAASAQDGASGAGAAPAAASAAAGGAYGWSIAEAAAWLESVAAPLASADGKAVAAAAMAEAIDGAALCELGEAHVRGALGITRLGDALAVLRAARGVCGGGGGAAAAAPADLAVAAATAPSRQLLSSTDRYDYSYNLRESILSAGDACHQTAGDIHSPPTTGTGASVYAGGTMEPVQVTVGVQLFGIEDVDLSKSSIEAFVWLRLSWKDPRVAWDPAAHGGVTQLTFAPDELWVPDFELYEQVHSISEFEEKNIMAWSDGSLYYSRPGRLSVMCDFEGLADFPFDKLACNFTLGGWAQSGWYVQYTAGDIDTPERELQYKEYLVEVAELSNAIETYPCCPDEPWPVIYVRLGMSRARQFYFRLMLVPNFCFTLLSFCTFLFHPECGERLGYMTTLLLALVATDYLAAEALPICKEWLWMEKFITSCIVFVFASCFETALVMYLHGRIKSHMLLLDLWSPVLRLFGYHVLDPRDRKLAYLNEVQCALLERAEQCKAYTRRVTMDDMHFRSYMLPKDKMNHMTLGWRARLAGRRHVKTLDLMTKLHFKKAEPEWAAGLKKQVHNNLVAASSTSFAEIMEDAAEETKSRRGFFGLFGGGKARDDKPDEKLAEEVKAEQAEHDPHACHAPIMPPDKVHSIHEKLPTDPDAAEGSPYMGGSPFIMALRLCDKIDDKVEREKRKKDLVGEFLIVQLRRKRLRNHLRYVQTKRKRLVSERAIYHENILLGDRETLLSELVERVDKLCAFLFPLAYFITLMAINSGYM